MSGYSMTSVRYRKVFHPQKLQKQNQFERQLRTELSIRRRRLWWCCSLTVVSLYCDRFSGVVQIHHSMRRSSNTEMAASSFNIIFTIYLSVIFHRCHGRTLHLDIDIAAFLFQTFNELLIKSLKLFFQTLNFLFQTFNYNKNIINNKKNYMYFSNKPRCSHTAVVICISDTKQPQSAHTIWQAYTPCKM